jgi:predicted Rossmann fold nucleotide-binding protein DprA/Smf involved in DNA uptake
MIQQQILNPIKDPCCVAVVGSRNYSNLSAVKEFISQLPKGCTVISGGARGVDQMADHAAKEQGIPTVIYPANWEKFGKSAGIIRNKQIVEQADVVVAFYDGSSRGTAHTISVARKLGKQIHIYP